MLWMFGLVMVAHASEVQLTHQARLLDSTGEPISGTLAVALQLYDGPGATAQPVGDLQSVPQATVANGYVSLPVTVDTDDLTTPSLWVEYIVEGSALTPRQPVSHVPLAARAAVADAIPIGTGFTGACSTEGALRVDTDDHSLHVCSDGQWRSAGTSGQVVSASGGYTFSDGSVAASCKAYRDASPGTLPSGLYAIDPAGTGAFPAWCDMSTDGGGWTLCYAYDNAVYDIGNWPSVSASRNKALAQTWGETELYGPGSRQGNFCNLMPVQPGSTQLAAEAREVSSGRRLERAVFTARSTTLFTTVHNAASQEMDCLTSTDGSARLMLANYTSPSGGWNGSALTACSGAADTSQRLTMSNPDAYGTDGFVVFSYAPSGEAHDRTLSMNINWYQFRSSQTLFANTGSDAYVTKFGIRGWWRDNGHGRNQESPGPYLCTSTCGYTDQVTADFGQSLWVR